MRFDSLTGSWSGAYRYRGAAGAEVVFNAQIDEVGGAFVGSTQEPNTFRVSAGSVLTAEIEGVRAATSVVFTKFYHDQGVRHAVRYEGRANDALTRIEGKWTIPRDVSGTFFMARDDAGEAAEAEERVEEVIDTRR